ncbi:MAG: PAS domain S-box protein [Verrucomicrobia bacterium]|nr:PAS domain S-box protein [Verrucomicrobiota bacterium]
MTHLNVLIIEDSESDAGLLVRELRRSGYEVAARRVETEADMLTALQTAAWDVILSDYSMPHFSGLAALRLLKEQRLDIPFIFVSGTIGEDVAVEAMKEGAVDYLLKDRLARLDAAVAQALETKRLRHEAQQTDAQLRLQQKALESAANGIVITNTHGEVQWANPAFSTMTGYALAEAAGQRLRFLKSGRHDGAFYRKLWETILAGEVWDGDLINRRKDGTLYPEHMTVTPVRAGDGAITHFIAIKQDVTERRRAEEELRLTHKKLRQLLAHSPAVIYTLRFDGPNIVPVVVSDNIERLLGVTAAESARYEWWLDSLHPEDRDRAVADASRGFEEGGYSMEYRIRHKDGTYRWVQDNNHVSRDASGQPKEAVGVWTDITERKRLEAEVRLREQQLSSFFSGATAGLMILDTNFRFVQINGALAEMNGVPAEEHIGKTVSEVVPELAPEVVPLFEHVLATGDPILNFELTGETPREPGVQRHWMESFFPVVGQDGNPQGVGAIVVEITEQKKAESALRESEERYRKLVELSPDAIYIHCQGEFVLLNKVACELFGAKEPAELIGTSILDRIHPAFHSVVRDRIRMIQEERVNVPPLEEKLVRIDGTPFDAEVAAAPFVYQGKPSALVIIRDITERKRMQDALRDSEARYRKLAELSPDGIVVHCDRQIVYANQVLARMVGAAAPEELMGRDVLAFLHPSFHDLGVERSRRVLERGEIVPPAEEKLVRLDGTYFDAELTAGPFIHQGKPAAISVIRDITEKKALNEKMLRNQRLESIGTLVGGIAHDLNNVLAPILMSLEILRLKFTDEPSQKILSTIAASAQRGADLVKQVLTFSRGLKGERVAVQLRHVVREMQGIIRETFPKSITLALQMPSDLWTVKGDATQLHQVLMNLCVNARDAMPNGGKLSIRGENLTLDDTFGRMNPEARPGPHVLLTIIDTGSGMSREVQRRIFEPFFTTKEPGKGTGLGLSTVLGIVKGHGGFITVETEAGQGTKFKVYLAAEPSSETRRAEAERCPSPTGHGELILVVDDEAAIQQIARETLQVSGYRVLTAGNGAEAVALCAQHALEVKLVLTDMMMPIMDGTATIRAVRVLAPQVKIIAASGLGSETRESDPGKLGVEAFLRKPYTSDTLLRTVAEVMGA